MFVLNNTIGVIEYDPINWRKMGLMGAITIKAAP